MSWAFFLNAGSSMPFLKASCSVLTTSAGVPFGAARPRHMPMEKGMPCSLTVGTLGNSSKRSSAKSAMILSLPALTWAIPSGGETETALM